MHLHTALLLLSTIGTAVFAEDASNANWPQAAGPNHNWTISTQQSVPLKWSAERNENIRWRLTLPESGQSGIAVWEDRLFLTTMKPLAADAVEKQGTDIVLYCVSASDGKILWQQELAGDPQAKSIYAYGFSDSSSPTPITDGKHVWFCNASGQMGCWTMDGEKVWTRKWTPTLGRPFNKQFEPIKIGNTLINVEPRDPGDPLRREDAWNFLRGFDATTGESLWVAPEGLTHYNTPVLSELPGGGHAVLSGRGAHHDVPEAPAGMTLSRVDGPEAGKALWTWNAEPDGKCLVTQFWDKKHAYWLDETRTDLVVLNTKDGSEARRISWIKDVTVTSYDAATQTFSTRAGVDLSKEEPAMTVFPAWHSNLSIYPFVYFACCEFEGMRQRKKMNIGPKQSLARINVETGKVEYLQLPFPIPTVEGQIEKNGELFYPKMTINSRGIDVAEDKRSGRSGWWWCFNGNTIAVNQYLYFTLMCGKVQVIDGQAKNFDQSALVAFNDLGTFGETWSCNTPSYSQGRLYHRTLKELLCIESKP